MNYRQTKQRQEVYETILGQNRHMKAEDVYLEMVAHNPKIGIATVYRNLNHLAESGKISRLVDQGVCYFDGNIEPHYHLKCIRCGQYEDLSKAYLSQLDEELSKELDRPIYGHDITFHTICTKCSTDNQLMEENGKWNSKDLKQNKI